MISLSLLLVRITKILTILISVKSKKSHFTDGLIEAKESLQLHQLLSWRFPNFYRLVCWALTYEIALSKGNFHISFFRCCSHSAVKENLKLFKEGKYNQHFFLYSTYQLKPRPDNLCKLPENAQTCKLSLRFSIVLNYNNLLPAMGTPD